MSSINIDDLLLDVDDGSDDEYDGNSSNSKLDIEKLLHDGDNDDDDDSSNVSSGHVSSSHIDTDLYQTEEKNGNHHNYNSIFNSPANVVDTVDTTGTLDSPYSITDADDEKKMINKILSSGEDGSPLPSTYYRSSSSISNGNSNKSSSSFSLQSLTNKLDTLTIADRREQRYMLAGSRDIISVLQGKHNTVTPNSNLRYSDLEILSSQLKRNASYRQHGPGIAVVVNVNADYIAIGTSKGLVLLFDQKQEIRLVIGSSVPITSRSTCSVTALDINTKGTLLICGYANGEVALWDVVKGALLKRVTDLHQHRITRLSIVRSISEGLINNSTIVSSSTTDLDVVTVDAKGTVNRLHFSRHLLWATYISECECLLDGSAGCVIDLASLHPINHSLNQWSSTEQAVDIRRIINLEKAAILQQNFQFVAFNSLMRTYVVQIQPTIRILHRWSIPLDDIDTKSIPIICTSNDDDDDKCSTGASACSSISSLSWNWNMNGYLGDTIKTELNPLLARCCGSYIEVLSLTIKSNNDVDVCVVGRVCLSAMNIISIRWLGLSTLSVLIATKIVFLTQSLQMIDECSLQPDVASGIKVSLDSIMDTAEQQQLPSIISSWSNRLYILAPESLHCYHLQSMKETADRLINAGKWLEALALSLQNASIIGVAAAESYIQQYVALAVSQPSNGSIAVTKNSSGYQMKNHYSLIAGVCIEYCLASNLTDFLYTKLFDMFTKAAQAEVFLESFEPYILSRKITTLPPHIVAALLAVGEVNGSKLAMIERSCLHLDVAASPSDIGAMMKFLSQYNMYSSYLYVHATGHADYSGAFQVIFHKMMSLSASTPLATAAAIASSSFPTAAQADIGYKLLLFLQYSIEGRIFPRGDAVLIPDQYLCDLLENVLAKHFPASPATTTSGDNYSAAGAAAANSSSGSSSSSSSSSSFSYPYLTTLSKIDASATLHCMSLGLKHMEGMASSVKLKDHDSIVDMYLSLYQFTKTIGNDDVYHLFYDNCLPFLKGCSAPLPQEVIESLIVYMSANVRPRAHAEAIVVEIILNQSKYSLLSSAGSIKQLLQKHHFWRACLYLDGRKFNGTVLKDFENVIASYAALCGFEGESAHKQLFQYIDAQYELAIDHEDNHEHAMKATAIICKHLVQLAELNLEQTKRVTCKFMSGHVAIVIEHTKNNAAVQYELLKALLKAASDHPMDEGQHKDSVDDTFSSQDKLCYINLLLTFSPDDLLSYVTVHDNYPLDECIVLCRDRKVCDALAWLLEKAGDVGKALDTVSTELVRLIASVKRDVDLILHGVVPGSMETMEYDNERTVVFELLATSNSSKRSNAVMKSNGFKRMNHILHCCVGICSRHSDRSNPHIWFQVFELLLKEKQAMTVNALSSSPSTDILSSYLSVLLQVFMSQMKSFVPAHDIIRIFTLKYASGTKYEEFKEVMISMIDSYAWEGLLNDTVVSIFKRDLHMLHVERYKVKHCGIRYNFNMNDFNDRCSNTATADSTIGGNTSDTSDTINKDKRNYVSTRNSSYKSHIYLKHSIDSVEWKDVRLDLAPPAALGSLHLDSDRRLPGSLNATPRYKSEYINDHDNL